MTADAFGRPYDYPFALNRHLWPRCIAQLTAGDAHRPANDPLATWKVLWHFSVTRASSRP